MTLAKLERFPSHSKGYATLPENLKRQDAADVPRWSRFIEEEAARCTVPYDDMSYKFEEQLQEIEAQLLDSITLDN